MFTTADPSTRGRARATEACGAEPAGLSSWCCRASAAALTEVAAVHRDDWGDELFEDDDPVGSLDGDKHPAEKHKGGSEVVCLICKSAPDCCKWANYKKTKKVMVPVGQACEQDMQVKLQVLFWGLVPTDVVRQSQLPHGGRPSDFSLANLIVRRNTK